jgi:thiol-disulfide isomerase/thioredoxin
MSDIYYINSNKDNLNELKDPVYHLTINDFKINKNDAELTNPLIPLNKIVFIIIRAGYCGHCKIATPEFQKFADENPDVFSATIKVDGEQPGEKELYENLSQIDPECTGFPHYVLYKNGKKIITYNGNRDSKSLQSFVQLYK